MLVLYCLVQAGFTLEAAPTPTSADSTSPTTTTPVPTAQPDRLYPEIVSNILEDGERVFTIAGIIAAGAWAYFNFFRGRTYRPRLEPSISGALSLDNGGACLAATFQVKNVGLSKVDIQRKGSALSIFVAEVSPGLADVQEIKWKSVADFDIFIAHQWIEPGELIQEQRLIAIPNHKYLAFRLDIRLVSPKKKEWSAMTIVTSPGLTAHKPPSQIPSRSHTS